MKVPLLDADKEIARVSAELARVGITKADLSPAEPGEGVERLGLLYDQWKQLAQTRAAERDELLEVLKPIAVGPCRIWPHPGPTRPFDKELVWPSNCLDKLDRGERPKPSDQFPCDRCRARAALERHSS